MKVIPTERFWRTPFDADTIPRLHGTVHVLEERCKGCAYCVEFCPQHVLGLSDRYNLKGYHPPEVVAGEQCLACRLCELICPEFAIGVDETVEGRLSHAG